MPYTIVLLDLLQLFKSVPLQPSTLGPTSADNLGQPSILNEISQMV